MSDMRMTLTVEEAAELLGVARGTAYEAARTGQLPIVRIGRRLLVPRHQLCALLGAPDLATNAEGVSEGGEAPRDALAP
jgi:excisionase family DNA binding protein